MTEAVGPLSEVSMSMRLKPNSKTGISNRNMIDPPPASSSGSSIRPSLFASTSFSAMMSRLANTSEEALPLDHGGPSRSLSWPLEPKLSKMMPRSIDGWPSFITSMCTPIPANCSATISPTCSESKSIKSAPAGAPINNAITTHPVGTMTEYILSGRSLPERKRTETRFSMKSLCFSNRIYSSSSLSLHRRKHFNFGR